MVGLAGGVSEGGLDIIRFKIREIPEDLLVRYAFGQHSQDVCHTNPQSPNTRPPAALVRLDRYALEKLHAPKMQRDGLPGKTERPAAFRVKSFFGHPLVPV